MSKSLYSFVCPYNSEKKFSTFEQFVSCPGCDDGLCQGSEFGCLLVVAYAHTAFVNNLHRVEEEEK